MRADRLIALLLLLQARSQVTAAEVAVELEISERTARRDLEALAMSGVPVYSTSGRGGGWRLLGGAKTDLTGLSADESRSLFLAAGPAIDRSPELRSALRKLSGALPETFRADAAAAASAIKIDPAGWGQVGGSAPKFLDELTKAVVSARQVEIDYTARDTTKSTRAVSPLGLVTKRNVWYLVANTDRGMRTFRLTRITSVRSLDADVIRPDNFDLEAEWARIVGEVQQRQGDFQVSLLADPTMLGPLRYQFAGRIEVGEALPDGRLPATIVEYGPKPLAAQLAGYGKTVELLNPPKSLVAELRRIATELSDSWLSPSPPSSGR